MKKTFLTFLAVGFGFSVAFAQTAETGATTDQPETMEQAQPATDMGQAQAQAGRTETELDKTPAAVQDAFHNGAYSEMEVLAVYEISGDAGTEAVVYEFELAPKAEGAEATETEGLETEKVSNRQPAVILYIDENGQVTEEEQANEME